MNHKEIRIAKKCPFCGKTHSVWVNEIDYYAWEQGELAQDAFPYLSAEEREVLISGICSPCWDAMFGSMDDEDEDEEE